MATVIGLTLVKINGSFRVDVKNARWSDKRTVTQTNTGGGVVEAIGPELCSGSFDEVIPKSGQFNWRALKDFSVQIYDKETRSVLLAAFEGCNWDGIDGSSDSQSAATQKSITWKGTAIPTV